jgi:hypothetical protein
MAAEFEPNAAVAISRQLAVVTRYTVKQGSDDRWFQLSRGGLMKLRTLPVLLVVLGCALLATAQVVRPVPMRGGDPMDGTWKVTLTPDDVTRGGGDRAFDDTLIFHADQFTSKTMEKSGFGPVHYELDSRAIGGVAQFTANPTSPSAGSAKWGGATSGQELQGTMEWTKKDGTVARYELKGTKQ